MYYFYKREDQPLSLIPCVIRVVLLHTEQIVQRHFSSTVGHSEHNTIKCASYALHAVFLDNNAAICLLVVA